MQEEEAGQCVELIHFLDGRHGGIGKRPHSVESGTQTASPPHLAA